MDHLNSSPLPPFHRAEYLLPALYAVWMVFFSGSLHAFELSADEGVNLIKAWLVVQGYPLYDAVWSDQPPLFTHLLACTLHLAGPAVLLPRALMIVASTVFLAGVGRHLRTTAGLPHALAAQTIILAQPTFYFFSAAIMVGLPALYLATAAALTALRARSSAGYRLLVASAALLALSMMTKLFTAVLVPVLLVLLAWPPAPRDRSGLRRAAVWSLFLAVFLAVMGGLWVGRDNLGQLLDSHWQARLVDVAGWTQQTLRRHLNIVPWLAPVAILGSLVALWRRKPGPLMFAGWAGMAVLALASHVPVWNHQQLLFSLPAAIVGGYGVGEVLSSIARRRPATWPACPRTATFFLLAAAATLVAWSWHHLWDSPANRRRCALDDRHPEVRQIVAALMRPEDRQRPVITDRPMLAYRAGRLVPAWTAALTYKRLITGNLSEAELISEITHQEPTQIVLARFPLPAVSAHLNQHAHAVVSNRLAVVFAPNQTPELRDENMLVQHRWKVALHRPQRWYGSMEARRMAEHVMESQGPHGGWAKRMTPDGSEVLGELSKARDFESLDNQSTLSQIRFLTLILAHRPRPDILAAWRRGVDYLLTSQYACGAWPQTHPHHANPYSPYATLNDRVSTDTGRLLAELRDGPGGTRLTESQTRQIGEALDRLQDFLVRSQIPVSGRLAGWAQQYDPHSLQPQSARTFEPAALASRETADVLTYLMDLHHPSPAVKQAVNSGAKWLQAVTLRGIRLVDRPDPTLPHGRDREVVADPDAPPIWARFYRIEDRQPIFVGRDGVQHASLADVEPERRAGYDFYTQDPATVLNDLYPAWLRQQDMR